MSHPESRHRAPLLALLLAGGGLASMLFVPGWLPAVAVAAVALLAGSALVRRRSRRLVVAIALFAVLLAVGLAGALLLRDRPVAGLGWTLLLVFALPLPLVPWLYWLTFETGKRGERRNQEKGESGKGRIRPAARPHDCEARHVTESEPSPLSPLHSSLRSVPGPRSPVPGSEGGP